VAVAVLRDVMAEHPLGLPRSKVIVSDRQ